MRSIKTIVTFTRPFMLPGFEKPHAPGSFEIRTDEEQLDATFEAWRRVETTILLTDGRGVQAWTVDPQDLQKALSLDNASESPGTV